MKNIIKIKNNTNKDFSFVPYGQNFVYIIKSGDSLEFKVKNQEQELYYKKQEENGISIESLEHFVLEPLVLGEIYKKIKVNTSLSKEDVESILNELEYIAPAPGAQPSASGVLAQQYHYPLNILTVSNNHTIIVVSYGDIYSTEDGFKNLGGDGFFTVGLVGDKRFPLSTESAFNFNKVNGVLFGNGIKENNQNN